MTDSASIYLKMLPAYLWGFWVLITPVFLCSVPAYAEWVAVEKKYQSPGLLTVYIDSATIRREGILVTMMTLTDWEWMQGNRSPSRFHSTRIKKQFDCADKRFRLLVITDFYGRMGTGRRMTETLYDSDGDWIPVETESLYQGLWDVACGKQ
ncbi:MAG: surface-adhesin E family protein [Nitrospiraceae bacterium]